MPLSLPPGAKAAVHRLMADLALGADPASVWHPDGTMEASHPWGRLDLAGIAALWSALRRALPDMERRDLIVVGGANRDDARVSGPRAPHLVAMLGHLQGTFAEPLLGLPPTGGVASLRVAEAHWLDGERVRRSWTHLDLVDLMRQAGVWPLPRSFGVEAAWPGPATQDGLRLGPPEEGGALDAVLAMHDALHAFDGRDVGSMPHERFWAPGFMYHAGGGIGACRGLEGFRAHHQIPFLRAFPDRMGAGHFVRVSDGPYAVTGGNVRATHRGEWLGMTATGRPIAVPVMDFYRLDGDGRIAENWLPIDVVGIAAAMGHDLLARAAHYAGRFPTAL